MNTKNDDGLKLFQGDVEVDASLLSALDELGDAPVGSSMPDHWVPPTKRRLSSAPPMSLTTDLPIRGVDAPSDAPAPTSRYRIPARKSAAAPAAAPAAQASATAVLEREEVTFEQVRQEGLEWLRDLARRRA